MLVTNLLAYVDPGAGSLVFQILIASLISSGVMLMGAMSRIWKWLSLRRSTRNDSEGEDQSRRNAA